MIVEDDGGRHDSQQEGLRLLKLDPGRKGLETMSIKNNFLYSYVNSLVRRPCVPLTQLLSVEHPLADARHHGEHARRVGRKLRAVRLGLQRKKGKNRIERAETLEQGREECRHGAVP